MKRSVAKRRARRLFAVLAPAPLCALGMAWNQAARHSEWDGERLLFWLGLGVFPGVLITLLPATVLAAFLERLHAGTTRLVGLVGGIAVAAGGGGGMGWWAMESFDHDNDLTMLPVCGAITGATLAVVCWFLRDGPLHPPPEAHSA